MRRAALGGKLAIQARMRSSGNAPSNGPLGGGTQGRFA